MYKGGPPTRLVLLFAVFFTNLVSLACQILWIRKIGFLFGTTHGALSTVLSIFLLGLSLGALAGGRIIDRHPRKMHFVALLEIALGLYVLLSLWVLDLGRRAFLALPAAPDSPLLHALLRYGVILACLIVPTLCIGAVFPVITRLVASTAASLGRSVSMVYALDTVGAALGALVCGFVLVPHLGLKASTLLLGSLCVVLGLTLGRMRDPAEEPAAPLPAAPPGAVLDSVRLRFVFLAFFLSGAGALLLETGWNRFYYILNGSSVYSLSVVMAAFLMGVGMGSWLIRRRADRLAAPLLTLAYLEFAIAIGGTLIFMSGPLFGRLYHALFQATRDYLLFQSLIFLVVFFSVFLATLAMGANFPLVVKACSPDPSRRGEQAGKVFFVNTLGAVGGAFASEFIVLPAWGFGGLILLVAGLYAAAAAIFVLLEWKRAARHLPVFLVLLVLTGGLAAEAARRDLPFDAVYYHGIRFKTWPEYRKLMAESRLLYRKDGFYGQVSVIELKGGLFLKNNGKTDSSNFSFNVPSQMLLSHLPLAWNPRPRSVAIIGLGGGFSLAAAVHHEDVGRIAMVELDPLVIHAARTYFAPFLDGALESPRVEMIVDDGRNFLERTSERFDAVISQPPNIWVSGVSGLFTQEFYLAVRERLNAGGILCQWIPLREMGEADMKVALATVRSVFPRVGVWDIGTDAFILASETLPVLDDAKLARMYAWEGIQKDLAALRWDPAGMTGYLAAPRVGFADMDRYLEGVRTLNRDDRPVLEFRTARNLYLRTKGLP